MKKGCGEWMECWRDPWSLLLKDKQTFDFLEVHLAHQIVLLFIKAAVLQAWLPWVFCSQQLVPIRSEPAFHHQQVFQEAEVTAELKRWLSSFWRRDCIALTGFLVNGLRACRLGQEGWMLHYQSCERRVVLGRCVAVEARALFARYRYFILVCCFNVGVQPLLLWSCPDP